MSASRNKTPRSVRYFKTSFPRKRKNRNIQKRTTKRSITLGGGGLDKRNHDDLHKEHKGKINIHHKRTSKVFL